MRLRQIFTCLALLVSTAFAPVIYAGGTYFTPDAIQQEVFADAIPLQEILWLTSERKAQASALLGQTLTQARIRYQSVGSRRLWILSEIGKEKPITFAVVTDQGHIVRMEVMVFREVRGDEIRLPQYTAQYHGQTLTADGQLSASVDGISGATYSVRSMQKVAKLALLLDRWANGADAATP